MYSNIGEKIKILAKIVGIGGAIACVLAGIIVGLSDNEHVWYLFALFPAALACIISSWPLYGFGELIQQATEIAENTSGKGRTPV